MSAAFEEKSTQEVDLEHAFEFLAGRLYYVPLRNKPHKQKKAAFFSIDEELVYWNFFLDFGPLNLGQLYRFCQILRELLEDSKLRNKTIYYYSSTDPQKKANAAFLICAFMMLSYNKTPEEAYAPFVNMYPPFPPFHDATPGRCTYNLTVLDCLKGVAKAVQHQHVDFAKFSVEEYEYFERVECGDLNWLVKDKFLAFAGPHEYRQETGEGYETMVPEDYIPYFKRTGVKLVIRLNKKCYDEQRFVRAGIKHLDLFYPDGSNPPAHILRQFLEACEAEPGAIAVHCKAGLGRTGTCIGCYMMKHFDYSAAETIGWLRVARPGSIIGPQQHFMEEMEPVMRAEGRRLRSSLQIQNNGDSLLLSNVQNAQPLYRKNMSKAFDEFESKETKMQAVGLYQSPQVEVETKMDMDEEYSQGDHLRSKKNSSAALQRARMAGFAYSVAPYPGK